MTVSPLSSIDASVLAGVIAEHGGDIDMNLLDFERTTTLLRSRTGVLSGQISTGSWLLSPVAGNSDQYTLQVNHPTDGWNNECLIYTINLHKLHQHFNDVNDHAGFLHLTNNPAAPFYVHIGQRTLFLDAEGCPLADVARLPVAINSLSFHETKHGYVVLYHVAGNEGSAQVSYGMLVDPNSGQELLPPVDLSLLQDHISPDKVGEMLHTVYKAHCFHGSIHSLSLHETNDGSRRCYYVAINGDNANESYGMLVDRNGQALLPPVDLQQLHDHIHPDQMGEMLHTLLQTLYNLPDRPTINSLSIEEVGDGSMCVVNINDGVLVRVESPTQMSLTTYNRQILRTFAHQAHAENLNLEQIQLSSKHALQDGDYYAQINSGNASYGMLVDRSGRALLPPVHLQQFHDARLQNPDQLGEMLHTLYKQAHRSNVPINSLSLDEINDGSMCYLTFNEASRNDLQPQSDRLMQGYVARVNSPCDMTLFSMNQWAKPLAYRDPRMLHTQWEGTGDHWSQYSKAGLVAELLSHETSLPSNHSGIVKLFINEDRWGRVESYGVDAQLHGYGYTDVNPITWQESQQYGRYQ